jgi:type IV secretion system protein VirB9
MLASLALAAAAPLAAQEPPPLPPPVAGDPRIQTVDYDADQVVAIHGAPGYQVTIELAPDERIDSVAVGDAGAWQAVPNRRGDHVFVKPLQPGAATNMTVVTDARVYLFDLVPGYGATDTAYTVRFRYPSPGANAAESATADMVGEDGRYRLSGAHAPRPSRISDDGLHTYIEWPRDVALPAVYAVDGSGRESLVNGMMRDDLFVIDGVSPRLAFRIDAQVARATRVVRRDAR